MQINLEECIKQYDDPNDICQWVFDTYSDVINSRTINQKQVKKFIYLDTKFSAKSSPNEKDGPIQKEVFC